jgi:hypothetical protein
VSDILSGGSKRCKGCSAKDMDNGKRASNEELKRRAMLGTAAIKRKKEVFWAPFTMDDVAVVYRALNGASSRCNNVNDEAYSNYGGRGIAFAFANPTDATKWVLDNLGPKPSPQHSIDRIDNSRHYEPGNLRWATRSEQARNKRAYKRSQQGEVIRRIQAIRGDITYECVRNWLKKGLTEEQIINRRKYARSSI